MPFLIGVIILIIFVIFLYFFLKIKIKSILNEVGLSSSNIKNIVASARIEEQEMPKSLASMDRIYLEQIKKDFSDININELKRKSEKIIFDCYKAVENKDKNKFKGNINSFVVGLIDDYKGKNIKFKDFKFHNTVVSKYEKEKNIATIYFSSSYQYYLEVDSKSKKVQDRAKLEFIYVIDASMVDTEKKVLGINCPNCGSPLTSLEDKNCSYCKSPILKIVSKVFTCNNIIRY